MINPRQRCRLLFCALLTSTISQAGNLSFLITADTHGELQFCQDCTVHAHLGGLARRSTLVRRLHKEDPAPLLVDTGNAFFGADSLPSQGQVITAAYDVLGYDAVNLSYRDFRLGRTATLELLEGGKFPIVSANLLGDNIGHPLAKPYAVKTIGKQRITQIGASQSPTGLAFLRHLKEQVGDPYCAASGSAGVVDTWGEERIRSDGSTVIRLGNRTGTASLMIWPRYSQAAVDLSTCLQKLCLLWWGPVRSASTGQRCRLQALVRKLGTRPGVCMGERAEEYSCSSGAAHCGLRRDGLLSTDSVHASAVAQHLLQAHPVCR